MSGSPQARWDQMTAQMAMVQKRAEEVGYFLWEDVVKGRRGGPAWPTPSSNKSCFDISREK